MHHPECGWPFGLAPETLPNVSSYAALKSFIHFINISEHNYSKIIFKTTQNPSLAFFKKNILQ